MPTSSEPITWQALEGVADALLQISTESGYHHTVRRVSMELFRQTAKDEYPALFVVAEDMPTGTVEAQVECYIPKGDRDSQIKAHRMIADVVAALPKGRGISVPDTGFLALDIDNRQILKPEDGVPYVVARVTIRLSLNER